MSLLQPRLAYFHQFAVCAVKANTTLYHAGTRPASLCCSFGHAYDADLALWNTSPYGPFASVEELKASSMMQPLPDGLRFTVVSGVEWLCGGTAISIL